MSEFVLLLLRECQQEQAFMSEQVEEVTQVEEGGTQLFI